MKTGFDILTKVFLIVNVASVLTTINGRVYRRKKTPINSELQDIVILSLTTANAKDVQPATIIINMFCANFQNGMTNETKLKEITDAVIAVLEAYSQTDGVYFDVDIRNAMTLQDNIQENMSYTSLRVICNIEK